MISIQENKNRIISNNINDIIYELNFKIMENNYDFSIIETIEIDTYAKSLRERKEIYVFKPKISIDCFSHLGAQRKIAISSEKYFMTKGIAWTKVVHKNFEFYEKFLDNLNFDKKNPHNDAEWNGLKIYFKDDLEQYIDRNFKTNIGFHRYYTLLKKIL